MLARHKKKSHFCTQIYEIPNDKRKKKDEILSKQGVFPRVRDVRCRLHEGFQPICEPLWRIGPYHRGPHPLPWVSALGARGHCKHFCKYSAPPHTRSRARRVWSARCRGPKGTHRYDGRHGNVCQHHPPPILLGQLQGVGDDRLRCIV